MSRTQKGWNRRFSIAESNKQARELLKQGATLDGSDQEGRDALARLLDLASSDGDIEMMKKLADAGAIAADSSARAYASLVRLSIAMGASERFGRADRRAELEAAAVWLAQALGSTTPVKEIEAQMEAAQRRPSFIPLITRAAQRGSLPLVRALLQAGADPNARGVQGGTALMAAAYCESGGGEIALALLDAGACPWQEDAHGDGAVDHASDEPHDAFASVLRSWLERQDLEGALKNGEAAARKPEAGLGRARRAGAL